MVNQDPEFVKKVLLSQIQNVEASLLSAHPNNGLMEYLETGTRYNGNGTVESYLSYRPKSENCRERIELTFSLACDQQKAVFYSEISWSDGKTIDEVVVCYMCPDCLDELQKQVATVTDRTHDPLVNRMVGLLENFSHDLVEKSDSLQSPV
jgi:hypothetical protein